MLAAASADAAEAASCFAASNSTQLAGEALGQRRVRTHAGLAGISRAIAGTARDLQDLAGREVVRSNEQCVHCEPVSLRKKLSVAG